jgi:hypothetical protein
MPQFQPYPSIAAMAPHTVLEEIGAPFQWVPVDRLAPTLV